MDPEILKRDTAFTWLRHVPAHSAVLPCKRWPWVFWDVLWVLCGAHAGSASAEVFEAASKPRNSGIVPSV